MQRRINPREANRMMQRMGMQVKQIDDVTRVVIESGSKKIIIDEPEVAIVTVQGQTVYQVGGGRTREEGPASISSEEDAKLVAAQAGVSAEEAANALRQSGGDLAQAIILLKQKKPS
ncbi:MAG TPA: nascent polypeptide-associated complex protein [Candidatus Bathyarchaeia archaeon]